MLLPNNAINLYLKEESMKQKESKFTLDCLNKKKSQLQFYNPLFDYHLHSYFNSHVNRKVLRTKGFINSKGYIMYDPVYRDLLGNSPQRKKQVPDKVLLNSITRLNIGKDINNKEIDVFNTVLKKTSPINRKLPMYHSLNKSNSTLYSNGQTNRNFNKTTRAPCTNKLPPIKKENQLGSSASMNCVFDTKKSYYKSEKSIENEKKRIRGSVMEDVMKKRGNCLMVYVPKELDHHFARQITDSVDKELEKGQIRQLVFDFSQTAFMDSSGIGMLMGRYRMLRYSGGKVTAIHVSDRIYRLMRLSGIYKYIEISQETVWHQRKR